MKKLTRKTAALIAAGALSVPLLGAVPALAQSGPADSQARTGPESGHRRERRQKFQSEVAAELGVSSDQLAAARRTVITRHVDEAVSEGRITEAEGQQIKDAIGTGTLRDVMRSIRRAHHR